MFRIFRIFLVVVALLIFTGGVTAQTPLATCHTCDSGNDWELYVGGTYTTIQHWYDGTYDPYKDLEIFSGQRPGHSFKLSTSLEVPLRWKFITGTVVGVDLFTREYENILTGYDWNQEAVSFTLGFRIGW